MPTPEIKIRPQPPHLHYLPISGSRLSQLASLMQFVWLDLGGFAAVPYQINPFTRSGPPNDEECRKAEEKCRTFHVCYGIYL